MNLHVARVAVQHVREAAGHPVADRSGAGHKAEKCTKQLVHLAVKAHRFLSNLWLADRYIAATVSLDKDNYLIFLILMQQCLTKRLGIVLLLLLMPAAKILKRSIN